MKIAPSETLPTWPNRTVAGVGVAVAAAAVVVAVVVGAVCVPPPHAASVTVATSARPNNVLITCLPLASARSVRAPPGPDPIPLLRPSTRRSGRPPERTRPHRERARPRLAGRPRRGGLENPG